MADLPERGGALLRTFLRRLVLAAAALAAVAAVGLWVASRTGAVQELVRARLVTWLRTTLAGADVDLGAIEGTLGRTLVIRDLRIAVGGRSVVHVPRIELVYSALALLRRRLSFSRVTVTAPWIRAVEDAAGWRLPRVGTRDGATAAFAVRVGRLEVRNGRVEIARAGGAAPARLAATAVDTDAAVSVDGDRWRVRLAALRLVPRGVAVSPLRAAGEIAAAAGALRLRDLDVATDRSHAIASGTIEPGRAADVRLSLLPLDAGELRALVPAARVRTDAHVIGEAVGPWRAIAVAVRGSFGPAGTLRATGTLDLGLAPFGYSVSANIVDLDPAAAWEGLGAARASGTLHARGRGFGLGAPVTYHVALEPLEVGGTSLGRATVGGRGVGGAHRLTGSLVAAAGSARLHGRVRLADPLAYRVAARLGVTHLEAVAPALPGQLRARLSLRGVGVDAAGRRAALQAHLEAATVRGVALSGGDVRADIDGDRLRATATEVRGPAFQSRGAATVDLSRRLLEANFASSVDLAALATGTSGAVAVEATARGPLDGVAIAATATGVGVRAGPTRADRARATVTLTGIGGATPGGNARVEATGAAPGLASPADVAATLEWRRAGDADQLDVAATAAHEGRTLHRLALGVRRTPGGVAGTVRTLVLTPADGTPWTLVRPADLTLDDGLGTRGFVVTAGRQQIAFTGRVGWRGPNAATVEIDALRLATLCGLVEAPACTGRLAGRITIAGTGMAPVVEATATGTGIGVEEVPYGDLSFEGRYAERRASVRGAVHHPEAGDLRVEGTVPVDLAWGGPVPEAAPAGLDLRVRADRLDLSFLRALSPTHVRRTAGDLTVDVRLTGSLAALRADGTIVLDGGRVELLAAGVPYEDLRARVLAAGDVLELTELYARGGDGTLEGRGRMDLRTGALDLRADLRTFLTVRRPAYEAALDGTIAVGGTPAAPDVRGDIRVARAGLRPAELPAFGLSLEPDPTITVVGGPQRVVVPEPAAPAFGEAARLALEVHLARNAWIWRPDAEIQLDGDVRIGKDPFAPVRLRGDVVLRRGWYAFRGRRFVVEEGLVRFTGGTAPEPIFDVTASYQTPAYRIVVHVGGAGAKPTLTLSSDPPLEQADILAVLLFGRPTRELSHRDTVGLQREAIDLTTDYSAPELSTSIVNTLGLHTLDVELPPGGTEPGRLTVGRYVRSDVFVSLAQEFGARAGQVAALEYYLTRRISVKGSTSTRGTAAVDVFWNRRY